MKNLPDIKTIASRLIAEASISSVNPAHDQSNQGVISLLAELFEDLGFEIYIQDIPNCPGKSNLVASLGQGDNGLVLSGHSDTVPCDADLWQSDPFKLTERDDRWYGLGSCDMKIFFAQILESLKVIDHSKLQSPLIVVATADEESSMSGARALKAAQLAGVRRAVIGEPTGLVPIRQHKGIMMLSLQIKGQAGHSSDPSLGKNAIEPVGAVIGQIMQYRQSLAERYQDNTFAVNYPTLNLGCIHGGDNPNRICDHVNLELDLRILPGMQTERVMEELQQELVPLLENQGYGATLRPLNQFVPPYSENPDGELLDHLCELTGRTPETVSFATEAPFLQALNLETIVLGAGSIDQAHQPDEFMDRQQLAQGVDILQKLIGRYCLS